MASEKRWGCPDSPESSCRRVTRRSKSRPTESYRRAITRAQNYQIAVRNFSGQSTEESFPFTGTTQAPFPHPAGGIWSGRTGLQWRACWSPSPPSSALRGVGGSCQQREHAGSTNECTELGLSFALPVGHRHALPSLAHLCPKRVCICTAKRSLHRPWATGGFPAKCPTCNRAPLSLVPTSWQRRVPNVVSPSLALLPST